ncbi:SixA phosphatase family protein [Rhizobium halophytocola]|uniref:Phosphohistidine phosphatase n=1 Tax=Rhizobium halophytocola TaxID=735519 RepID=A0ABS4DZ87_9HYPH|nr:histidine phosphatase family protein [Rhizobium halophytocola]MBP1850998.1 phosphohistidine phosphatase [Rhizobium halophytocola]
MTANRAPQRRIYLVRHASAAWTKPGMCDFDRPLTDQGIAEARDIAARASACGYHPAAIWSSSAVRCRHTTEILAEALECKPHLELTDTLYNCESDIYHAILDGPTTDGALMIVGHNPTLEDMLIELAGSQAFDDHIPFGYPTAGLAALEQQVPQAGPAWRLAGFLSPGR